MILICGLHVSCGRGGDAWGVCPCFGVGVGVCDAGVVTPPPLEKCFFGFHLTRAVSREPCGFLGVLGPVFPDLQLKKFLTRVHGAPSSRPPGAGGTKTSLRVARSKTGAGRWEARSKTGAGRWEARQSKTSQSDDWEVVALTRVSSTPSLSGLGVVGKRSKLKLLHADIRNPLPGVPFSVRGKPLTRGTTARPHRRAVVFVISVRYGRLRCPSSHAVSSTFEKARSRGLLVHIDQRVSRGCVIHAGSSCVDSCPSSQTGRSL